MRFAQRNHFVPEGLGDGGSNSEAAIPLYYFHMTNGRNAFRDRKGEELRDLRAAHDYALEEARDVIRQTPLSDQAWTEWTFEITDECGRYVLTVPFAEAEGGGSSAKAA